MKKNSFIGRAAAFAVATSVLFSGAPVLAATGGPEAGGTGATGGTSTPVPELDPSALTYIWTGAGADAKFSTAANWKDSIVPSESSRVLVLPCFGSDETKPTSLINDIDSIKYNGVAVEGSTSDCKSLTVDKLSFNADAEFRLVEQGSLYVPWVTISSATGASHSIVLAAFAPSMSINTEELTQYGGSPSYTIIPSKKLILNDTSYSLSEATPSSLAIEVNNSTLAVNTGIFSNPITFSGNSSLNAYLKGVSTPDGATGKYVTTIEATDSELSGPITLNGNVSYYIEYLAKLTLSGSISGSGFAISPREDSNGDFENKASSDNSNTKKGLQEFKHTEVAIKDICKTAYGSSYFTINRSQVGILDGDSCDYGSLRADGILKGNGTLKSLYLSEHGVVAPGNSPGKITITDRISMARGTTYQAEILNKDAYDQLIVGKDFVADAYTPSPANIDGAKLDVRYLAGGVIKKGNTFTIVDNQSSAAIEGIFDGLDEGAELVVDGAVFTISYKGGDGNDIVLTAQNDSIGPKVPNTGVRTLATSPVMAVIAVLSAVAALGLMNQKKLFRKK